jgi:hypothetical protein
MKLKKYLPMLALLAACATEPEGGVSVRVLNVYVVDSLTSEVTFEARSSGPFFWRLEWLSGGGLFDYGDGNVVATVPVEFGTSFRFWMDFMAWTDLDTARVTFMNTPEE